MTLNFEIIRILDDNHLIDSESYQRRYSTRDGRPLVPGHYVALWDESSTRSSFDESATYVGPYKSSREATVMLEGFLRSVAAKESRRGEGTSRLRALARKINARAQEPRRTRRDPGTGPGIAVRSHSS